MKASGKSQRKRKPLPVIDIGPLVGPDFLAKARAKKEQQKGGEVNRGTDGSDDAQQRSARAYAAKRNENDGSKTRIHEKASNRSFAAASNDKGGNSCVTSFVSRKRSRPGDASSQHQSGLNMNFEIKEVLQNFAEPLSHASLSLELAASKPATTSPSSSKKGPARDAIRETKLSKQSSFVHSQQSSEESNYMPSLTNYSNDESSYSPRHQDESYEPWQPYERSVHWGNASPYQESQYYSSNNRNSGESYSMSYGGPCYSSQQQQYQYDETCYAPPNFETNERPRYHYSEYTASTNQGHNEWYSTPYSPSYSHDESYCVSQQYDEAHEGYFEPTDDPSRSYYHEFYPPQQDRTARDFPPRHEHYSPVPLPHSTNQKKRSLLGTMAPKKHERNNARSKPSSERKELVETEHEEVKHASGSSELLGLSLTPTGNWRATLVFARKSRQIGTFYTREQAALARDMTRDMLKDYMTRTIEEEEAREAFITARTAACSRVMATKNGDTNDSAAAIHEGITLLPSGEWLAEMNFAGKDRRIGTFDEREQATLAREIVLGKLKDYQFGSEQKEDAQIGEHWAFARARVQESHEVNREKEKEASEAFITARAAAFSSVSGKAK